MKREMILKRAVCLLVSVLSLTCVPLYAQQKDIVSAEEAEVGSTEELVDPFCSALLFRMLPGEFNFCMAQKYWTKGKFKSAEEMLQLSAGWGNKAAQRALGIAYFNGDNLPKDRPLGLAWLELAAERKESDAVAYLQSALAKASPDERQLADQLRQQLLPRYGDAVAALRADRHLNRKLKEVTSNGVYGAGWCFAGVSNTAGVPRDAEVGSRGADVADVGAGKGCTLASEAATIRAIRVYSDLYFEGWKGHVTVGELEAARK